MIHPLLLILACITCLFIVGIVTAYSIRKVFDLVVSRPINVYIKVRDTN
jgi:hypothetical protein